MGFRVYSGYGTTMTATVRRAGVELALSQPPPYHQSAPAWELHPGTGLWESRPTIQGDDPLEHDCVVEIDDNRLTASCYVYHSESVLTFKFWTIFDSVKDYGPTNTNRLLGQWTARYIGEPCEFWLDDERFAPENGVQMNILESSDGPIEVVLSWIAVGELNPNDQDYHEVKSGQYDAVIERLP